MQIAKNAENIKLEIDKLVELSSRPHEIKEKESSVFELFHMSGIKKSLLENTENLTIANNYKCIPLICDFSDNGLIDVSMSSTNKSTLTISGSDSINFYEINATVGVQYLNENPNDVEVNYYTFGLCDDSNNINKQ